MTDTSHIHDIASYHQFAAKSKTAESYFQRYDAYHKVLEVLGFQHNLAESASYLLGFKYKDEKTLTAKGKQFKVRANLEFPRLVPTSQAYISYAKTFFKLWSIHKSVLSGMPYVNHVFRVLDESIMGQYYIACYPDKFESKFHKFEECRKAECEDSSEDRPSTKSRQRCHYKHLKMDSAKLRKALYKKPGAMNRVYAAWSNEEVHFNPLVWRDEDPDEAMRNMCGCFCVFPCTTSSRS